MEDYEDVRGRSSVVSALACVAAILDHRWQSVMR